MVVNFIGTGILCTSVSICAMYVIVASICTHSVMHYSLGIIPELVAIPLGLFMLTPFCFLWIPMITICTFGILGEFWTWPFLVIAAFQSWWPSGNGKPFFVNLPYFIVKVMMNVYRLLFPPFQREAPSGTTGLKWLLFQEPCQHYEPDKKQSDNNKYPKEVWIFANGMAVTKEICDVNRDLLYKMFDRPIHLLQNPTNGFLLDLLECMIGKTRIFGFGKLPVPNEELKKLLKKQLIRSEIKKVVLIAHSQGTIITGNVLQSLPNDPEEGDKFKTLMQQKLEVYNFAACAHLMPADNVQYLENISNGGDIVAYLGHLFPFPKLWITYPESGIEEKFERIKYDKSGKTIYESKLWGHMFNTHYLLPMMYGRGKTYKESKLVTQYMKKEYGGQRNDLNQVVASS